METYTVTVNDKGDIHWYQNEKLHRIDGPAIERADGDKEYWQNDKLHRTDGPAIEKANGDKFWFLNGGRHRIDGPAIERATGDKFWYQNDQLHRTDGPACECNNGQLKLYWIAGVEFTYDEFIQQTTQKPVKELTVKEIEQLLGYAIKIIAE
jgi:hypothetical protein